MRLVQPPALLAIIAAVTTTTYAQEEEKLTGLLNRRALRRTKKAPSCSVDNGGCDINCEETPVGAQCSCPDGFDARQDGRSCEDINECADVNGGCHHQCHNNHGSFRCSCEKGYQLEADEKSCTDLDECELNDTCAQICRNSVGSYECSCFDGFISYAVGRCGDIDECSTNNGGCEHTCENTIGGFRCSCQDGYTLHWNKKDCIRKAICPSMSKSPNGKLICNPDLKSCLVECERNVYFASSKNTPSTFSYWCGNDMGRNSADVFSSTYPWITRYNRSIATETACAGTSTIVQRVKFKKGVKHCSMWTGRAPRNLRSSGDTQAYRVISFTMNCDVTFKRKKTKSFITVLIELLIGLPRKCDARCQQKRKGKAAKTLTKLVKRSIAKQNFLLHFTDADITVGKQKGIITRTPCEFGEEERPGSKNCASCVKGTRYNARTNTCASCPNGSYQDLEGQLSCIQCPENPQRLLDGIQRMKRAVDECPGVCQPGQYSLTGLQPCFPCDINTYQPEAGRLGCYECGTALFSTRVGSVSFDTCPVRARCPAGHYYDVRLSTCKRCPEGFYQHKTGQNFCYRCPTETATDSDAQISIDACKDRRCGGVTNELQGVIESPNYPGEYPTNIRCQWNIVPPKGRKILLVIPEIHLRGEDNCGDHLVMRKSASPSSTLTYESCQSLDTPAAITARSKKLWVEFSSDGFNTAKGFQIPYVTYDENYDAIIKDIIGDYRLFSPNYHEDILTDKKLRTTLFNVLAHPQNYFILRKENFRGLFRKSFIDFLQEKVVAFLNPQNSR